MAIEQRVINGSLTEIYISGGGNFMTQSYPTNFHTFLTRKVLAVGESIADWMEVTPAEKARLEAADAAWRRPPQWIIDLWNTLGFYRGWPEFRIGCFNETTGYFELCGVKDITYEEAIVIYSMYKHGIVTTYENAYDKNSYSHHVPECRAFFWPRISKGGGWSPANYMFRGQGKMERLEGFPSNLTFSGYSTNMAFTGMFSGCSSLISTDLIFLLAYVAPEGVKDMFKGCTNLENIKISQLRDINLSLADSPRLSLDSFKYMIDNSYGEAATITVHPEVYTKLTEGDEEWRALNELALSKQITFAIS